MNKIFNYFIYLVIFQSLVSSNSNIKLKKNITSLLNTTDLISFNNQIIASTNGGIYSIDNQSYSVHNDDLDIYDISCISKENDKLWIGSNTYGSIQVLNSDFNLIKKIDYPSFDKIKDIAFSNNHAYSIVVNENEDYIARYLIDSMQYLDIIDLVDGKINDIKIDENFVYVLTDAGYYKGELNSGNYLALNQYWDGPFYNEYDMLSFELSSGIFIASKNEEYYSIHDENIHLIDNLNDDFVNTYNINNSSFLLTKNSLYTLTQSTPPLIEMVYSKETMNFEQLNDFTSYTFLNNNHYFGLKNNGVLIYSNELSDLFIPNTIYKNQFDAIYYTENEKLIGVANHGIYSNKLSGGFVYSEVLSNNNNNENINNFYSWPSYKINNFPESSNFYKTDVLNYWFGGKTSYSISIIDNNIYFSNSGIYNDEDINNVGWDPMSNFYDFYASEFSFYYIPEYNDLTYG